jgi:uncharacterized protein (DUF58 family)
MVDSVLSGQYRSHFKGQGVQFSEHRLYVPGDDVRHINWNVTARTREPLVKKFDEERELSVFLVVDVSGSKSFGSSRKLKSETVAEIGAVLAYAATRTGDQVGVLFFSGKVEKIIPPKKGRQHILRIIRELLMDTQTSTERSNHQTVSQGTDLRAALEATDRIMKHRGVVFLISDFIADGYQVSLRRLAKKHDVVAISIGDEREETMPELGQILFCDPETGREAWVDTSSYAFKKWFQEQRARFRVDFETILKGSRVEHLRISTQEDYMAALVRFFRVRGRRKF